MQTFIALLSFAAFSAGSWPYVLSVKRGDTNPHKMAMIIFLILGFLNAASQFAEGATYSLVFPLFTIGVNIGILLFMHDSDIGAIRTSDKVTLVFVLFMLISMISAVLLQTIMVFIFISMSVAILWKL